MDIQFLYDTHIHTVETSSCAKLPAVETVDYYASHGYTGLVITDHLHEEFIKKTDNGEGWNYIVDHFLTGYTAAKKRGDEIGFDVILGAEMRFTDNNNDYLVYDIDEAWLYAHPYIVCQGAQEFFAKYHTEVLIMHAHPYRDGNLCIFENAVHGIELINTNSRHENHTDRAVNLAKRHPEYYLQAGSDMHQLPDRCQAGIISPRRIRDSHEYAEVIRSGKYDLYAPQFSQYINEYHKLVNGR